MNELFAKKRTWRRHVPKWLQYNRSLLIKVSVAAVVLLAAVQLLYPSNRMLPLSNVEGLAVGGWQKEDVVNELNKQMNAQAISLRLEQGTGTYSQIAPKEIGITINNNERIEKTTYPWYVRLVPTSLFWYNVQSDLPPARITQNKDTSTSYVRKNFGKKCAIPAKDASLEYKDKTLKVVSAKVGGNCETGEVVEALGTLSPRRDQPTVATLPVSPVQPKVKDEQAAALKRKLEQATAQGVKLDVLGKTEQLSQDELLSWMEFSVNNKTLTYSFSSNKAKRLTGNIAKQVAKPAGTSYITTRDFTVVSKKTGATGRALAVDATLAGIKQVIEGDQSAAKVFTASVKPKVKYTRTYTKSSTGIAALLQHYAEDNAGEFGVAFQELGGRGLQAEYNSSKSFITASTYKLFVAYSVLKRIDADRWEWDDKIAGQTVEACFDKMIKLSDNPCAEAMYKKIGYKTVINEARALGLTGTTLASDGQRTTARDLRTFLTKLEGKSIGLKTASRDKLLSVMKENVYRQGVPAGASGTVADKVGFLNGLLHDASIVYSPKGTYVLVVMTDGSSWANIADLTKKIEALR